MQVAKHTYRTTGTLLDHLSCHPAHTLVTVTRWIAAHRRVRDIRPWQRVATARTQALLVLRWFSGSTRVHLLARDAGISIATAYRYLHEAVDVIALRAPDLHDVLATARQEDWPYVCLDGTLIPTTQLHGPKNPSGAESWYSGKHHRHGGNIQVLCDPSDTPCGSPRSVRAPPTTSPPPEHSPCPRSTPQPPPASRH